MLEQVLAAGSADPFAHYAHAMELRSLGRLEEALAAYRRVIERFPEYVPTYLMAGQVAEALGRVDEARGALTAGVERARLSGDAHAASELSAALTGLDDE